MIGEIDDVMTLITDALCMSQSYDARLNGASEKLRNAENRDQIKAVVEGLVKSTREMQETNKALENRPTLSKTEISNLQHSLEAICAYKPDRSADRIGQPQDSRPLVRDGGANGAGERRAVVAPDVRHRPFQSFNDFATAISPAIRCCGWSRCR